LIEFDLASAEWIVTAYLSGDPNMLEVAASGRSPHVATGALISGATEEFVEEENKIVGLNTDPDIIRSLRSQLDIPRGVFLPRSMSIRQAGKKSNHALNYGMGYRRFALENEIMDVDAKPLMEAYTTRAYPGLRDYWEAVRSALRKDRTLTNPFGRKVRLLGEWGQELWMQGYAFLPQSTVFDVCRTGMMAAFADDSAAFKPAKLSAQVHDSLLFDYLSDDLGKMSSFILRMKEDHMKIGIGITDPRGQFRDFTLGVDVKIGQNWGSMVPLKSGDPEGIAQEIRSLTFPPADLRSA
jgi:hypothetical protein